MFQSTRRTKSKLDKLWNEYSWKKQNLKDLAKKNDRSIQWVRNQLEKVEITKKKIVPQATVFVQIPHSLVERGVFVSFVHHYGRKILEDMGWVFQAVVVDGRRGMIKVFKDIPLQISQFHQMKIVTKYLTRKPETDAGKELRSIMLNTLSHTNEKEFTLLLSTYNKKWGDSFKEKTCITGTKHWYYTHKKVRSAYRSLETNLPYLFTYQKYPEFNIPNTTNSLDGSFVHLKDKVKIHHVLRKDRRYKMIEEILSGEGK